MSTQCRPFDPVRFDALAREHGLGIGSPCHYLPVTGSTNDDLMASARAGVPAGALHIADLQTKGRGRHGNTWSSPRAAENLLFTVLLRPNIAPAQASCYTLAVGLALRDALQPHLAQPVGIKWTNDVYVAGRKLAGILVESQLRGDQLSALVVGIGLNVHMTELPDEIARLATSLSLLGAKSLDREALLVDVLMALEKRTAQYAAQGLAGILDELREHDVIVGKRVRVLGHEGIARGISDSGALLLELGAPGEVLELTNGLVELVQE
jgi:BirA family transcriptional regulator, biotin operon repressor / biotin---[acetyl-CoA-carboxylase] ligase